MLKINIAHRPHHALHKLPHRIPPHRRTHVISSRVSYCTHTPFNTTVRAMSTTEPTVPADQPTTQTPNTSEEQSQFEQKQYPKKQKQQQQQQQQTQPKKQKQPQAKRPDLVNKKDFPAVFAHHFPEGAQAYVDTHCHIDAILDRFNRANENKKDSEDTTASPPQWDVTKLNTECHIGNWDGCVTVCCEPESYEAVMNIIDTDTSGKIFGAFGVHPHEAHKWDDAVEAKFEKSMSHPKVIAWGECGLDFFYNNSPKDQQIAVFIKQIALAVKHKKPLVVHTREAEEETVEILLKHLPKDWPVHIHCCTSSPNMVKPLLENFTNLYVGFTGCITFKNAEAILETVAIVPLNRLLLETDGPYMAPIPFRGAVAHSGMIPFTAVKMAEVKKVSVEELMKQVRENTRNIYGF